MEPVNLVHLNFKQKERLLILLNQTDDFFWIYRF